MSKPTTVLELLVSTRNILNELGWVRGSWQQEEYDSENDRRKPGKVCLAGAMFLAGVNEGIKFVNDAQMKVDHEYDRKTRKLLDEAAAFIFETDADWKEKITTVGYIPEYNDKHDRTEADIKRKLDNAIRRAQRREMKARGMEVVLG